MFLAQLVILHAPNINGPLLPPRSCSGGLKQHLTLMVHAAGSAIFHCLRMEIHQIKKFLKKYTLDPRSGRDVTLQQSGPLGGGGIRVFLSTNQRLFMQMSGSSVKAVKSDPVKRSREKRSGFRRGSCVRACFLPSVKLRMAG